MCDQSIQWGLCFLEHSGTKNHVEYKKKLFGEFEDVSRLFSGGFPIRSLVPSRKKKKPSSSVMNAPIKQSPRIKTRPHIIEINYSIFSPIRKSSICSKPSFIKCLSSCLAGRFCFPFGDCCPCFRSQPSSYIYNIYIYNNI